MPLANMKTRELVVMSMSCLTRQKNHQNEHFLTCQKSTLLFIYTFVKILQGTKSKIHLKVAFNILSTYFIISVLKANKEVHMHLTQQGMALKIRMVIQGTFCRRYVLCMTIN